MRVLALDYGEARCGCAVSDPTGALVRPLPLIEPPGVAAVAALVEELGAELVVVGLPVSLGGGEGAQAAASRDFRDRLAAELGVPVETYDERFTTRMARQTARAGAAAPEDSLAAAHLLESYLAARAGAELP